MTRLPPRRQTRHHEDGIVLILVVVILFALVISATLFLQTVSVQRAISQAQDRRGLCQIALLSGRAHAVAVLDHAYAIDPYTTLQGRWMTAFHHPPVWLPETAYAYGDLVIKPGTSRADPGSALWHVCVTDGGGTSGTAIPAFQDEPGTRVTEDGGSLLTWYALTAPDDWASNILGNTALGLSDYDSPHEEFTVHDGRARWHPLGFFDEDFFPVTKEVEARHVLRYAVGIIDQSGLLLVNRARTYSGGRGRLGTRGHRQTHADSYGSTTHLADRTHELTGLLHMMNPSSIQEWNVRRPPTTASHDANPDNPQAWIPFSDPNHDEATRAAYLTKQEMIEGYESIRVEHEFREWMAARRFDTSSSAHDAYNWTTIARELGADTDGNRAMIQYVELLTPFGNGLPASTPGIEEDIQWHVNINTAPREVLRAMLRLTDYSLKGGQRVPTGQPDAPALPRNPSAAEDVAYILAIDDKVTLVEDYRTMTDVLKEGLTDSFAPFYREDAANLPALTAPRPGLDTLVERILHGVNEDEQVFSIGHTDFDRPTQRSRSIRPFTSNQDILDLFRIPPPPAWTPDTVYAYGDRVISPADAGTPEALTRWYVCVGMGGGESGGTSGGAAPAFPENVGQNVVDNTIRWHRIEGYEYDPRVQALVEGIHGMKWSVRKSNMFRVVVKGQLYDLAAGRVHAEFDVEFVYHPAPRDDLQFDAGTGVWSWPGLTPPDLSGLSDDLRKARWVQAGHMLYLNHIKED